MFKIVLTVIFLIPTILGISEILHFIKLYIVSPKTKAPKYVLLFLCGENCFEQLKAVFEEYAWQGKKYAEKIVALDCGIRDCDECIKFAEKNEITILKNENLAETLRNL